MKKTIAGLIIVFGLLFLTGLITYAEDCGPDGIQCGDSCYPPGTDCKPILVKECKDKCNGDTEFCDCKCNGGIVLNTNFPFIGRCINKDGNAPDGSSSISGISRAFTNIFMTLILTGGFAMVIRGGVQIAMGQNKDGMAKIRNVVIAFAALGSLGIILRLINPNFFK